MKEITIEYRKLGKEQADGLAFCETNHVVIDSRIKGERKLNVLIHEILHCLQPKWSELRVEGNANVLAKLLYEQKLRFIEED